MQVNTCAFRFTSSKNAIKPPLSILKELAEFLEVHVVDKGWIEVPQQTLESLSADVCPFKPTFDSPLHGQKHQHLKKHEPSNMEWK